MTTPESQSPDQPDPALDDQRAPQSGSPDQAPPNPRAFVTASGFVLQIVGFVLAFGGCCLWSLSGWLQDETTESIHSTVDYVRAGGIIRTVQMVQVLVTFVAGLGLIASGLGLQGERPGSGRWALGVSGFLGGVWLCSLVALIAARAGLGQILLALIMTVTGTLLFLLAGNSARLLKLYPPPEDQNVVSEDFLAQYRRRGDE